MSERYAIRSLDKARAYLDHKLLGARYRECAGALQDIGNTSAKAVFGTIDALKPRSSLTLFAQAKPLPLFDAAISRWFGDEMDEQTLILLDEQIGRK